MNDLIFSELKIDFQENHRFYGVPSIFLTVCGCTNECINNNELCKYSNASNNIYTINDAKDFIKQHKNIKNIVINGGEPLIYKKQIEQFLTEIYKEDQFITIYTKGSLPILNPINPKIKIALYIVDLTDKSIPNPGDKIIKNGKEFIFGTNDIEKMNIFNINTLRDICVYCSDYLLLFKSEPNKILDKANYVIEQILDTKDEFSIRFLNKYHPKNNIVFSSRNKEEQEQIKNICIENGILFNKIY